MNSYLEAAELVFKDERRVLGVWDILILANSRKYLTDKLGGKTPYKTMQARLSEEIVRNGDNSRFVRTAPGKFFLRELLPENPEAKISATLYQAKKRRPLEPEEKVLCIPKELFEEMGRFQGIENRYEEFCKKILQPQNIVYLPRLQAEATRKFKQIITYTSIFKEDQILSFKRGVFNWVENFLRGQRCIGFGGHVTESDFTLFDSKDFGITNNVFREINEELSLPLADKKALAIGKDLKPVGVLNDDSSHNGQRHLAILFNYKIQSPEEWTPPKRGETSITKLKWQELDASSLNLREFEYWSQLVLRKLIPNITETQPSYRIIRQTPFKGKHVLCIIGSIGSGKSAACEVLKNKFGYREINSGRAVAEILGIPPVPKTSREKFQKKAQEFIQTPEGPSILAKTLLQKILVSNSDKIILDGIRQIETLRNLKKLTAPISCATLFIHTPPDVAFNFYKEREKTNITLNEFMNLYTAPVEQDLPLLIEEADLVFYNWNGKKAFDQKIIELLAKLV